MSDHQDVGRLVDMLHRAYQATHDEEVLLGVPHHEQSAILQHLRLRVIPVQHVAENFEHHLQRDGHIAPTETPVYIREVQKLHRLSEQRRRALLKQLMAAEGVNVEGHGDIEAFVYDYRSGEYIIRSGIGQHALATITLYEKVRSAELGHRWPLDLSIRHQDMTDRMHGYVAGFIVRLPGWQTPFLHVWFKEPDVPAELWHNNLRQVQDLRIFLVVQDDGTPVDNR